MINLEYNVQTGELKQTEIEVEEDKSVVKTPTIEERMTVVEEAVMDLLVSEFKL